MNTKHGFTLTEVLIATGILGMFIAGVMGLYTSGSKMGNQNLWLQSSINQLKNTARQINSSIRRSSYPSSMKFPHEIIECKSDCFKLHYYKKQLCATESLSVGSSSYGSKFLVITESSPAKAGYSVNENHDATLTYHVFSLAKNGDLTYARYEDSVSADNITDTLTLMVPSGNGVYKTTLAKDVESVLCAKVDSDNNTDSQQAIKVTITSRMPHANTSRTETTVGNPNVDLVEHDTAIGNIGGL